VAKKTKAKAKAKPAKKPAAKKPAAKKPARAKKDTVEVVPVEAVAIVVPGDEAEDAVIVAETIETVAEPTSAPADEVAAAELTDEERELSQIYGEDVSGAPAMPAPWQVLHT